MTFAKAEYPFGQQGTALASTANIKNFNCAVCRVHLRGMIVPPARQERPSCAARLTDAS